MATKRGDFVNPAARWTCLLSIVVRKVDDYDGGRDDGVDWGWW